MVFARGENSPTRSQADSAGSPSKKKAPALGKGRQIGWLGSLKRGFFGGGDSGSGHNTPDSHFCRAENPALFALEAHHLEGRSALGATLWRPKTGER